MHSCPFDICQIEIFHRDCKIEKLFNVTKVPSHHRTDGRLNFQVNLRYLLYVYLTLKQFKSAPTSMCPQISATYLHMLASPEEPFVTEEITNEKDAGFICQNRKICGNVHISDTFYQTFYCFYDNLKSNSRQSIDQTCEGLLKTVFLTVP